MAMRRLTVFALALGWGLATSAPAPAHDGPAASDESRLRAIETAELGPEHAAAHARQRRLAARAGPLTPAPARQRADAPPPGPPSQDGAWAPAVPLPVLAINIAMLPTGKVLMFAYPNRPGYGDSDYGLAYVWDPVTGDSKPVHPPIDPATGKPTNIWCAGTSFLADGRVLVAGGNVDDPRVDFHGIDRVFTFDPFSETWEVQPRMAQGRWYPSQLLLPDGRTVIVGGLTRPGDRDHATQTNLDVEVFSPSGSLQRLEDFRLGAPGRPPAPGLYPHMFWMPDGRALVAGPQRRDSWYLDLPRPGEPIAWADVPDLNAHRDWGTAVLLEGGRVLTLGGSGLDTDGDKRRPPTDTTELFDQARAAAGWTAGPPLAVGRSHHNSVLLPDGTIATFGGGFGEDGNVEYYRWVYDPALQTRVELLDPRTGTVRLGPAQAEGRTYHSTAMLLPDGRVMSAGDDINGASGPGSGTSSDTAEIYSPPYLFRGRRPQLTGVPEVVEYGKPFDVDTPDGPSVRTAVLVAPGAVTHATDMNQRRVELAAPQQVPGGLRLVAPADADDAPPGYYMLFLLDASGVPSIARWVRLPVPPPPVEPAPAATPTATATPSPTPAPSPRLSVRVAPRRLKTLVKTRLLPVTLRLDRAGSVSVAASVELTRRTTRGLVRVRTVRFRAGGAMRLRLRLTAAGRRALTARRSAYVRVRATARTAAGTARASTRALAR